MPRAAEARQADSSGNVSRPRPCARGDGCDHNQSDDGGSCGAAHGVPSNEIAHPVFDRLPQDSGCVNGRGTSTGRTRRLDRTFRMWYTSIVHKFQEVSFGPRNSKRRPVRGKSASHHDLVASAADDNSVYRRARVDTRHEDVLVRPAGRGRRRTRSDVGDEPPAQGHQVHHLRPVFARSQPDVFRQVLRGAWHFRDDLDRRL